MTGEELATGVATALNAIASPTVAFTALNEPNPSVERETDDVLVQLWPFEIEEEEISRGGGWLTTGTVVVLVTSPLSEDVGRSEMLTLMQELREAVRALEIGRARHLRTEVTTLWDGEAQRTAGMFQASMRVLFTEID